ncbi:MAG: OmpA family protein [Flavobacteriaceae bacterium]|nr:OmpA family protein [Flavobacteriaceae bacterium]
MNKYIFTLFLLYIGILSAQTEGSGKYSIKNLSINTQNSDFGASYLGDYKFVYASPKKGITLVNDVWLENGQRYLELYVADILPDGVLANPTLLKGDVNTRYHEADAVFTKDLKTVYFTRNNYYNEKLARDSKKWGNLAMFKATVNEKEEWVNIIPMPFNDVEYSVGHPALSDDERTLYFVSDMPGTHGKTDIFKVSINQSGFGNPVNLGPEINSLSKEFTPFIDGDVMYYSSDRPGGLGGLDIYATQLSEFQPEPIWLNKPINSAADDFAFVMNKATRLGYFSSNRAGGAGDDDIYSFIEEEPVIFKCKQLITGIVKDKNTAEIIRGATVLIKDMDGTIVKSVEVDNNGLFSLSVYCETEYILEGSKSGYTPQSKPLTTNDVSGKETKLLILLGRGDIVAIEEVVPEGLPEVLPEEIVKVRPSTYVVNIEPIYFELNSSYLNKEAKRELEKVVDLMTRYPEMIIESGSHTDSRGIEGYNIWLSDRRAKSTVTYIIDNGIDPGRITGKGYGESQLINGCSDGVDCSESQHAMNRRTEFVIIKM